MTRTIVVLIIAALWTARAEPQTLPRFEILPTAYGSNQGVGEYNAYKIDRTANKLFYCRAVIGGPKGDSATCRALTTAGIPNLSKTQAAPVDPGEGNAGRQTVWFIDTTTGEVSICTFVTVNRCLTFK
jgi:hypothetical protein